MSALIGTDNNTFVWLLCFKWLNSVFIFDSCVPFPKTMSLYWPLENTDCVIPMHISSCLLRTTSFGKSVLFKLLWIVVYVVVNDISKVICSDRIHPVRPIRFSKSRSAIGWTSLSRSWSGWKGACSCRSRKYRKSRRRRRRNVRYLSWWNDQGCVGSWDDEFISVQSQVPYSLHSTSFAREEKMSVLSRNSERT